MLGIGTYQQDCGSACVSNDSIPNLYFSCTNTTCAPTLRVTLAQQVTNPVLLFSFDNNGVLIQLPSVPSGGTTLGDR